MIKMLNIQTTQEYFGMTTEQLAEVRNEYGYTREDCKILDDGLKVLFYDKLESIENENDLSYTRLEMKAILKTIDNRYAVILN